LSQHWADSAGIWVVLAKKGTTAPTSLTYDEALDEAVCYGWIDGQVKRRDDKTYLQRFTPRRVRSNWAPSNIARVERLMAAGRLEPPGLAAVDAAKAEGRWEPNSDLPT
jgi:uncharacterized protein YdeI (YjbR/CyaY-like superfamily)